MNLGLFNRMNLKDSNENRGMYSEWTTLNLIPYDLNSDENQSVLGKFALPLSKEITLGVVRKLASNLGIQNSIAEPSLLQTDKDVLWCMEVICFGLSLPLTEHEAIKDCVNVYCEWLSALLAPKICVPQPIIQDPNLYARRIITHLHFLFIPRNGEGIDTINRQAVLCHRVLRTLQQIAHQSSKLNRETWESLLLFLLAINDTLLAAPSVKDDVADQLCERVLSVLFEIWLIACATPNAFPSPPLWKSLRESCMNWRHRLPLIEQWNRVNLVLTAKLLEFMYGSEFPQIKLENDDDLTIICNNMSKDCVAQSWYRFFNTIGNPITLTKPEIISQTRKFLQFAIQADHLNDPSQHPCLQTLPAIFLKAVKGVASQVDAFLGITQNNNLTISDVYGKGPSTSNASSSSSNSIVATSTTVDVTSSTTNSPSPTPSTQRRLAKSFSVAPSSSVSKGISKSSLIGLTTSRSSAISSSSASISTTAIYPSSTTASSIFSLESKVVLASSRPKCNSILHLFGEWLFEAAFLGCDLKKPKNDQKQRPNSILIDSNQNTSIGSSNDNNMDSIPLNVECYESGRAEALGTLCRIMCAKKTVEEILPVYLARFYLAIQQGLSVKSQNSTNSCGETMTAILLNSTDLFRLDLDGVRILIPAFLSALEIVLPDKDLKIQSNMNITRTALRRASIQILSSLLVLPLHFQNLSIKELINSNTTQKPSTFAQFKPRLMNLVMNALQIETDPFNTHLLLGNLLMCVQDASILEKIEPVSQPFNEASSNLLSSDSGSTLTSLTTNSSYDHRSASPSESLIINNVAQFYDLPIDSAHALFVRATYLVCHRLISSWNTDLNVSLAALELLSGLARIQIKESDAMECKRAVKWLCDYIIHQCSRPPPAHSKDLHSTIVAAFQCCSIWLLEHPYLLRDKDCLTTVLEVAELGVSGTKSSHPNKPGECQKMKEEKELKPVSMRVRDAADSMLTLILEQVSYFPNECGPESISSLLDEVALLQHCNSWPPNCTDQLTACERFRYFVTDEGGSVLIALLEEPMGNDQNAQPTVTILIRGPFGRHAWTMQLRHLPRHRSGTAKCQQQQQQQQLNDQQNLLHSNPGRPVYWSQQDSIQLGTGNKQKYFPDGVERLINNQCKVDQSIPTLQGVIHQNDDVKMDIERIIYLIERQINVESNLTTHQATTPKECLPPAFSHDFQTSRLFLSHFGLLSSNSKDQKDGLTALTALNTKSIDFCKDLTMLDHFSSRTCDTVHIFYVKTQQTQAEDILRNARELNGVLSPYFYEFIHSLGWCVNIETHSGWSGHISSSWKIKKNYTNYTKVEKKEKDLKNFDGTKQILYWADAMAEIAFVVPTTLINNNELETDFDPNSSSVWYERSLSEIAAIQDVKQYQQRTQSLELTDKQQPIISRRSTPTASSCRSALSFNTNIKIMVVWLECFEDCLTFPIDDLYNSTNTGLECRGGAVKNKKDDCFIIFLHLMSSGLLRVHLQGPCGGRVGFASPLTDGMVCSRRALGQLVRQTALNITKRRRLDNDSYQPPHIRRRLKIQEIVQKYKMDMSQPELLTYLFK